MSEQKYGIDLNLLGNAIYNAVLHPSFSSPEPLVTGHLWYDTSGGYYQSWNGTGWTPMTSNQIFVSWPSVTGGYNTTQQFVIGGSLGPSGAGTVNANLFQNSGIISYAYGGLGISNSHAPSGELFWGQANPAKVAFNGNFFRIIDSSGMLGVGSGGWLSNPPNAYLTVASGTTLIAPFRLIPGNKLTSVVIPNNVGAFAFDGTYVEYINSVGSYKRIMISGDPHNQLSLLRRDDHPQYIYISGSTSRNTVRNDSYSAGVVAFIQGTGGATADGPVSTFSIKSTGSASIFDVYYTDTDYEPRVSVENIPLALTNHNSIRFQELAASGNNFVSFVAPSALNSDVPFILPTSVGISGSVLRSLGDGNLTFDRVNLFGGDSHRYFWSSGTPIVEPSLGYLSFNNATYASVTRIPMSYFNGDLVDIQPWVDALDDAASTIRGRLRIFSINNSARFVDYNINDDSSAVGVSTNSLSIHVAYVTGSGLFTHGEEIVATFCRAGDDGVGSASGLFNIDGGSASSVYTSTQVLDGGGA